MVVKTIRGPCCGRAMSFSMAAAHRRQDPRWNRDGASIRAQRLGDRVMNATLLITRTLNNLQRQYVPSYLGLRVFAESTAKNLRNEWTTGYVERRCATRRRQAYWKYSGVKGQDES